MSRTKEILGPSWDFECHPDLSLEQLIQMTDVEVICEAERKDTEGVPLWIYTVSGRLNGVLMVAVDHIRKCVHGCLVEGDAIIVHGKDRAEADWIAQNGLEDTIAMLRQEMLERGTLDPGKNAGTIASVEARASH